MIFIITIIKFTKLNSNILHQIFQKVIILYTDYYFSSRFVL